MRIRPTLLPFVLTAAVACQATDPASFTETNSTPTGDEASTPAASSLATEGVATVATEGLALATNVTASQEDDPFAQSELRMQRARALSRNYTGLAEQALARGDLDQALELYAQAGQLDPANEEADEGFRRVLALRGDPFADGAVQFTDDVDRLAIQEALARTRAQDFSLAGERAMREGDYDAAIQAFRQAETVLKLNPLVATNSLDERTVRAKLEEAYALQTEAAQEELEAERRRAEEALARREEEERNRLFNKLQTYYRNANDAFMRERYDDAAKFAELILVRDPGNPLAKDLLELARESGHARTDARLRREYREEWLRTFDELRTMDVPQTQALTFDIDRWSKVADRTPLSELQLETAADPQRDAVRLKLEQTIVPASFSNDGEGAALRDVADYLQQASSVNFQISPGVADLDEEDTAVDLDLPARSVRNILDTIALTNEEIGWKIEDGIVLFVTPEELIGGQVNATYSVADLVTPIPDYAAPEINVEPSQGLNLPEEDPIEREANVIGSTQLEELIRQTVAPESWDNDPANTVSVTERGQMVVSQTPEVQRQIVALLEDLRESTGILVDIQARFMRVEDNFLEDIGVDVRGLGQPGLGVDNEGFNDFGDGSSEVGDVIGRTSSVGAFFDDGEDGSYRARVEDLYDSQLGTDEFRGSGGLSFQWAFLNDLQLELILRAVQKSERVETVTAPRVLVNNGARANLSVLNQVAYVQDFDVQIAQAASIADPIIKVIQDGVILDVRPVVSADRRFITLELRPTIATLTRPIREQPTTLGTQNTVTIQLPEVEIQRVRTSIPIPDGGTVLLGGLKQATKQDNRSGVPILNKIPLLNAFFERKGNFVSNSKLLILLNAQIEIPYEQAPSAAELGRDI